MSAIEAQKSVQELYAEREKRVADAIALKPTDRVPVQFFASYFPAKYTGITCEAVYYDPEKWREANRKTIIDMVPDTYWVQGATTSGLTLETLGALQIRWPGHGAPPDHGHQIIEGEPMHEDEYDAFLADPSDFTIRTYLPRVWSGVEGLAGLPPLKSLIGSTSLAGFVGQLAKPELAAAFETIRKATEIQSKWQWNTAAFTDEMAALGFPAYSSPRMMASAPFDTISDHLRGMRGAMLDMYRRPEKLLRACDMLADYRLDGIKAGPAPGANPRVFIALHRGSDGFMSLKQFDTFYWPTFKKVLLALIDKGWIPCPFFEGTWDSRLERLLELPRGKVLCHFAQTDAHRARTVLGGHLAFTIDFPATILQTGSVNEVEEACKKLIDTAGKGGGFIMTTTCIDEAKPENVKALFDCTKRYGVYK